MHTILERFRKHSGHRLAPLPRKSAKRPTTNSKWWKTASGGVQDGIAHKNLQDLCEAFRPLHKW